MKNPTPQSQCKVITVANLKGGVGKTTTAMNVGVALARKGKRVLLIDSDPQANLTSYLGVMPGDGVHAQLNTLDQVYLSKRPIDSEARKLFIAQTESGVDLIASDKALAGVEYYLFSRADREMVLDHFLNGVRSHYDVIVIDTPPSMNLLTMNALCASDHVIVPVQPEFFSLEGIVKIRESIENVRDRWNERLSILGILLTQVAQRRKLTQEVTEMLRAEMGDLVFESQIHENAAVTESSGHAQSVIEYDRASRGAKDYLAAAQEIFKRLYGAEASASKANSRMAPASEPEAQV